MTLQEKCIRMMGLSRLPHLRPRQGRSWDKKVKKDIALILKKVGALPLWVKKIVALMLGSRIILYAWMLPHCICKKWCNKIVDPFLFWHCPQKIYYIICNFSNDVGWVMLSWAMCIGMALLSDVLFIISVVLLGWNIADCVMFWVNYNHAPLLYIDFMWTALALIYGAIKRDDPVFFARIKSIF